MCILKKINSVSLRFNKYKNFKISLRRIFHIQNKNLRRFQKDFENINYGFEIDDQNLEIAENEANEALLLRFDDSIEIILSSLSSLSSNLNEPSATSRKITNEKNNQNILIPINYISTKSGTFYWDFFKAQSVDADLYNPYCNIIGIE